MRLLRYYPKSRVRNQLRWLQIFSLFVLICLILSTVLMTDVHIKAVQTLKAMNISERLQNAIDAFQNVVYYSILFRNTKFVLLWTDQYHEKNWLPSTKELDCKVKDCIVTSDHSLLSYSSAVIMHWQSIDINDLPICVPSEGIHCPLWVLFNRESPHHTRRDVLEAIQDNVHWTVTYRKDSDIHAPYGEVIPKQIDSFVNLEFDPRKQLICWLVSNCETPSKREVFVSELQNYTDVSIYGLCSNITCPYSSISDCYQWMSDRCLFYLSLENSICIDYVTEKLYYAMASGMIPIVMGNVNNYEHLPRRSYVNAADFSSAQELVEYLEDAVKDKTKYMSHLWWKNNYEVKDLSYKWYCDLCEKLHTVDVKNVKPHNDLVSWWYNESQCSSWTDV